jgi:hypothetical protein
MSRYGGGIHQKATFEMIEYLSIRMPERRRMLGSMFNYVAAIPISVEFNIARLAVAIIKANATCGPIYTVDNVGTVIMKGDIIRIKTSLKTEAMIAEGMLSRARVALDASGKESVIDMGDLEVNVLLALLNKHPEKKTVNDVVDAFTSATFGAQDDIAVVQPIEHATPSGNMVMVDDVTGAAINVGMQTIASHGWEVGMVAYAKNAKIKRAHLDGNMFSVTFISNDGSVSLTRVTEDGSLSQNVIQKSMVDFVAEFVRGHRQSKSTIEYIEETTIDDKAMKASRTHAACVMALQQQSAAQTHKCKLQMKPEIDVQAAMDMAVAEMLLVSLCASNLIQPIKSDDTSEYAFVANVIDGTTTYHFSITGDIKKHHVLALAVKRVDETASSEINAKIEHVSVSVPFKGVGKTRSTMLKVLIPCVRLTCDVLKNVSIVMAMPKRKAKKRAMANLELGSAHTSPGQKGRKVDVMG